MTLIGTKTESPEGVTTSLTIRGSQNQLQVINDLEKNNFSNTGSLIWNGAILRQLLWFFFTCKEVVFWLLLIRKRVKNTIFIFCAFKIIFWIF